MVTLSASLTAITPAPGNSMPYAGLSGHLPACMWYIYIQSGYIQVLTRRKEYLKIHLKMQREWTQAKLHGGTISSQVLLWVKQTASQSGLMSRKKSSHGDKALWSQTWSSRFRIGLPSSESPLADSSLWPHSSTSQPTWEVKSSIPCGWLFHPQSSRQASEERLGWCEPCDMWRQSW